MVIKFPKVSIIILNYNGAEDTKKCLYSFLKLQYPNYELIVVDNGSTDNSVKIIKERFPNITLIEGVKNLGYSGGNNLGIKYCIERGSEYVLIVNNDTELVNPYFLHEMIKKMGEDTSIGIIGPRVLNPGNQVQDTILFIPSLFNCVKKYFSLRFGIKKPNYYISKQVDAVSGVCWLIKMRVIEEIGLLAEDYFMYGEEQDYCFRAKKAGWKILYYPVESILHYKETTDKNRERSHKEYIYGRKNLVLFLCKHYGFWQALLLANFFIISNYLKVIYNRFINKEIDFYNMSLLFTLSYEFMYVLGRKWKDRANKG